MLEHGDSPEARRRVRQQELSSAVALVHLVYGPPWRPRRVPHREAEMAPRLSEAIDVLQGALDAEQNADRLRAARTLWHLWSCLEAASSAPRRRNPRPQR